MMYYLKHCIHTQVTNVDTRSWLFKVHLIMYYTVVFEPFLGIRLLFFFLFCIVCVYVCLFYFIIRLQSLFRSYYGMCVSLSSLSVCIDPCFVTRTYILFDWSFWNLNTIIPGAEWIEIRYPIKRYKCTRIAD
jgi:hypothetical protein